MADSEGARGAVLVTGASTGIGRACAVQLARRGHRVFAGVRKEADARAIEDEKIGALTPLFLDVTDAAQIADAARTVESELEERGLAGLVNNAGIGVAAPMEYVPLDALRRQFEVNLFGAVAVTQALMPAIRRARGRIVNVSSIGGRNANPLLGPYCASKFALEAVSDSMRRELRPWGIHVAVIEPGTIDTPIFDKANADADAMLEQLPEEGRRRYGPLIERVRAYVNESVTKAIPPGRVADAVIHALTAGSPRTRYLVGTDARVQAVLSTVLPDAWSDALTERFLGLPRSLAP